MRILDVGCGQDKLPGATGIDRSPETAADVVHDLDSLPWPFPDDAFDGARCQDVLEHLDDIVGVMEEIHRLVREGGEIRIRVPHFSSVHAYTDPTHRHFFSTASFDYFRPELCPYPHYSRARFALAECRLTLWKPYRLLGIEALANRWPGRYEKMFAFVFPAMCVEFVLRRLPRPGPPERTGTAGSAD